MKTKKWVLAAAVALLGLWSRRPREARQPSWRDGTAAMAAWEVAGGWRCEGGQPQARCIRRLLRRLGDGRLRPFRRNLTRASRSCVAASACAASRAATARRTLDVVSLGAGHG